MTPKKKLGRPATGETPQRNIRVKDGLWEWALGASEAEGSDVTKWIIEELTERRADHESGTPRQKVRVDEGLWNWALGQAEAEGSDINEWISEALAERRARHDAEGDGAAG